MPGGAPEEQFSLGQGRRGCPVVKRMEFASYVCILFLKVEEVLVFLGEILSWKVWLLKFKTASCWFNVTKLLVRSWSSCAGRSWVCAATAAGSGVQGWFWSSAFFAHSFYLTGLPGNQIKYNKILLGCLTRLGACEKSTRLELCFWGLQLNLSIYGLH